MPLLSLQDAVDDLYKIAVVEGKSTSTKRLSLLAEVCAARLAARGLEGAQAEVIIPGGGREKSWDVAWKWAGKYRLVISLKSILKNLSGTVPNRVDDLMGETTNIQLYSPEVVTGYIMIFDIAEDAVRADGKTWSQTLDERLFRLSGRRAPYWSPGTFESYAIVNVNFTHGPEIVDGSDTFDKMLDELVAETLVRNPGIREAAP